MDPKAPLPSVPNDVPGEQAPGVDLQAELRQGREHNAALAAERQMRGTVIGLDRVSDPHTSLTRVKMDGFTWDSLYITPDLLLSLEAINADTGHILEQTSDTSSTPDGDELATLPFDDAGLRILRYNSGLSFRLEPTDNQEKQAGSEHINRLVQERFKKSPVHRELAGLHEQLESGGVPAELSTNWFDPNEDPLGTLVFLGDSDIAHVTFAINEMRQGASPADLIAASLENIPSYRARVTEDESQKIITWGKGNTRYLVIDKANGHWRFAARQRADQNYPEVANQAPSVEATPFIDTECAREMLGWMGENGIMFAPSVQQEIMRVGEADRYGALYTQLTREVAKWVNTPSRLAVGNLFVPLDPDNHGVKRVERNETEQYEHDMQDRDEAAMQELTSKLANIDITQFGRPAALLFGMVKELLNRTDGVSDLPVTDGFVSMNDGSCFDVAAYYIGAAGTPPRYRDRDDLREVDIKGVKMLEKHHGKHTFLLLQDIMFNGVNLPKGSLMSQQEEGDWAFLRLTPFCFDTPEDQLATGSELAKTLENEKEAISRIGGFTLRSLLLGVQSRI